MPRHLLVVADSLAFYGPQGGLPLRDERLYPNVAAAALTAATGERWIADVVARLGWTARDGWWALSGDPWLYSEGLPRADALLLALGSMDWLPATVPTYLREGIRFLRPGGLRRTVRRTYLAAQPYGAKVLRGRMRMLPQSATDHYLSLSVRGVRYYRPDLPLYGVLPAPGTLPTYGGVTRAHAPAVAAARAWSARENVPMLDLPSLVGPAMLAGRSNPDGMHWALETHAAVGAELARLVSPVP